MRGTRVIQALWPRELDGLPRRTTGFDFLVGTWQVHNRRLRAPLTGSEEWYETSARAASMTMHNGSVSIDEMWYAELGFAGSSIRVHTPEDDLWSIYWVSSRTGELQPPVSGRWNDDGTRFEAQGPDVYEGQPIISRYYWHSITDTEASWEQAFSTDQGQVWETNWVMTWTRGPWD